MGNPNLKALAHHADVRGDLVSGTGEQAQRVFDQLREAGIDVDDVFAVLETEGVQKFAKSWTELLDTVAARMGRSG